MIESSSAMFESKRQYSPYFFFCSSIIAFTVSRIHILAFKKSIGILIQVDIAFIPFVERFQPLLLELKNYDITSGRPKLAAWIEVMFIVTLHAKRDSKQTQVEQASGCGILSLVMLLKHANVFQELNKMEAYKQTKWDINELTSAFKKRVLVSH